MEDGESLVFLISQPRAGSTLLQAVLGNHPSIFAPAEPWFMLHLAFMINGSRRGLSAPYDSALYDQALREFAERCLPRGIVDMEVAVRRVACDLYGKALDQSHKSIFLDKTPRYYLIVDELLRTFPQARFIFLLRNPLAVLTSIVYTWRRIRGWDLGYYRGDLLNAPLFLLEGIASARDRACIVHYEDFIASPITTLKMILRHLKLGYSEGMEIYGTTVADPSLGDSVGIHLDVRPNRNSEEKWLRAAAADPVIWRLQRDCLDRMGPGIVDRLGYSFADLSACLDDVRPPFTAVVPSLALATTELRGRHDEFIRRLRCKTARVGGRVFRTSRSAGICNVRPETVST